MKNKKGFTLVELLAVIVILALIMGIAVVSIGGVLNTSRERTFRESATSILNGVVQQLYIENKVPTANTNYTVTKGILEHGGDKSSYGESFLYDTCSANYVGNNHNICTTTTSTCNKSTKAFVQATVAANGNVTYKICLSDGTHWVFADNTELLNDVAINTN